MSHRIPILPPFIPSAGHVGHGVPVILFSDVYDLPRLRDALNWPLLEWSDIKKAKYNDTFDSHASDMEGVDKEVLGCWGAQQAFDKNNRPTPASTPGFLNLGERPKVTHITMASGADLLVLLHLPPLQLQKSSTRPFLSSLNFCQSIHLIHTSPSLV